MNKEQREQIREANRIKNQRRKESRGKRTIYAEQGREERRRVGGAFGQTDAATFNKLSEGTAAQRRAEADLEHHAYTGD